MSNTFHTFHGTVLKFRERAQGCARVCVWWGREGEAQPLARQSVGGMHGGHVHVQMRLYVHEQIFLIYKIVQSMQFTSVVYD